MKYIRLIFNWIYIILRILPYIEELYPQIIATIEIIGEEAATPDKKAGTIKKINVSRELLLRFPSIVPSKIDRIVDSTVTSLKQFGIL